MKSDNEGSSDMDNNEMVYGGDHHQQNCGGASVASSSRWNPTKEQISLLENLYRQGIRTPNADQIQQITGRLRAFGHIEGKNVFYWFQNHKARQRQKQKQESLAYFHRFLHATNKASHHHLHHHHQPPPVFLPANVACNPFYLPQSDLGFYQHYPKVVLPMEGGGFMRIPRSTEKINGGYGCEAPTLPQEIINSNTTTKNNSNQETLPLFPLHPTGILQGREKPTCSLGSSPSATEESTAIYDQPSPGRNYGLCYNTDNTLINFFSGQSSCGSD